MHNPSMVCGTDLLLSGMWWSCTTSRCAECARIGVAEFISGGDGEGIVEEGGMVPRRERGRDDATRMESQ